MHASIAVAALAVVCGFVWFLVPSLLMDEFEDRLAIIPSSRTHLNVNIYEYSAQWSRTGGSFMLYYMNSARGGWMIDFLEKNLAGGRAHKVLDAGCGGGILTNYVASHLSHSQFVGVDIHETALKFARDEQEQLNLTNIRYEIGSIYSLPFKNASFDVVICSDVLEHLTDLRGAIRELSRVLQPDGVLLFDTIHRSFASLVLVIVFGEHVLRFVPPGAHQWSMFITPEEMATLLKLSDLQQQGSFEAMAPTSWMVLEIVAMSAGLLGRDQGGGSFTVGGRPVASYVGAARKSATGL